MELLPNTGHLTLFTQTYSLLKRLSETELMPGSVLV